MKFRRKSSESNGATSHGKFQSVNRQKLSRKGKRGSNHPNAKGDIYHFENSTYEGQEAFLFATFARLMEVDAVVSEMKNEIPNHPIEDDYRVSLNINDLKKLNDQKRKDLMNIKQRIQKRVAQKNKQRKLAFARTGRVPDYTDLEKDLSDFYAMIPIEESEKKK